MASGPWPWPSLGLGRGVVLGGGWRRSAPGRPRPRRPPIVPRAGAGTEVRPPAGPSRRCTPRGAGQGRCCSLLIQPVQCRAGLPAASSRVVTDPESVRSSGSPPLRTRRAAWAAASPPDTRLCMRWTLASSAALYRRKPPGVRVGWRPVPLLPRPEQLRTDPGPFGQFTDPKASPVRDRAWPGGAAVRSRPYYTSNRLSLYRPLTTSRGRGTLSTGPRQTLLDEGEVHEEAPTPWPRS